MKMTIKEFELKCLKSAPEEYKKTFHVGEPPKKRLRFIDRENVIASILRHFECRWNEELLNDKSTNPLVGVHSVPGGGKSYLLDVLATLDLSSSMF
jgi:hypothetical protein